MAGTIDVIVPCYGQTGHTIRFLKSFTTHKPHGTRLVLVDNGTPEREFERILPFLDELPEKLVIRNSENLGFVQATNQGLQASTADFVVLQNNDTEIYDGCYQSLRCCLEDNPKTGVVGAVSSPCGSWVSLDRLLRIYPELKKVPGLMEAHHSYRAHLLRFGMSDVSKVVAGMVPFFCVMLRSSTVNNAGLLSEDYGVGLGDDDDYCALLRHLGYEVRLDLSTYVFHNHRTTFKSLYTEEQIHSMQRTNMKTFLGKWRAKK